MAEIKDFTADIERQISSEFTLYVRFQRSGSFNPTQSNRYTYNENYQAISFSIGSNNRACIVKSDDGNFKLLGNGALTATKYSLDSPGVLISSMKESYEYYHTPGDTIATKKPTLNTSMSELYRLRDGNDVVLNVFPADFFNNTQLSTSTNTPHQFGNVSSNTALHTRATDPTSNDYTRATSSDTMTSERAFDRNEWELSVLGNAGAMLFDFASNRFSSNFEGSWTSQKYEDVPQISWGGDCFPVGILMTGDYEKGKKYIDDGTIPDDSVIYSGDGEHHGKGPDDSPESKYTGKRHDTDDDVQLPTVLTQTTGNTLYKCSKPDVLSLVGWLWSGPDMEDAIINALGGFYDGITQNVVSVTYFPLETQMYRQIQTEDKTAMLGRLKTNLDFHKITSSNIINFTVGEIEVEPFFRSFADYKPYTELYLYLPYASTIPIDTNAFMNNADSDEPKIKLKVKMALDLITGSGMYLVCKNNAPYYTVPCQLGYQIPLVLNSSMELYTSLTQSVINAGVTVAGGAVAGGAGGAIAGGVSAVGEMANGVDAGPLILNGASTPSAAIGAGQQCMLIRKQPIYVLKDEAVFAHTKGRPCEQSFKLEHLKGFTQINDPCIDTFSNGRMPTDAEIEEIYELMRGGIYL